MHKSNAHRFMQRSPAELIWEIGVRQNIQIFIISYLLIFWNQPDKTKQKTWPDVKKETKIVTASFSLFCRPAHNCEYTIFIFTKHN